MNFAFSGLYAITPCPLADNELLQKVEAALQGGCRIVQYRDKSNDKVRRLEQASRLRELCHRFAAVLLVNDDLTLALQAKADGVHLGQDDLPINSARRQAEKSFLIGATCHDSLALAKAAQTQGANYLAFGRFFSSHTKSAAPAADLAVISQAKKNFDLPLVAIGGVTVDNASSLIAQGADCVAVSHDLFQHNALQDIRQRAEQFSRLFK